MNINKLKAKFSNSDYSIIKTGTILRSKVSNTEQK